MMKTKGIGPTQSLRPNSASDRKDKEEKTLSLEKLLSDRGLVREKMLGLERKLQSSDRRLLCNPEEERSPTTMKEEEKRWEKEEETLLSAGLMAAQNPKWRLRISMNSSIIVQMNRLLREVHVHRIRMTPFRWCLHVLSPLEVNLELLKVMVCRWTGHDNQQQSSSTTLDDVIKRIEQLQTFIVQDLTSWNHELGTLRSNCNTHAHP
ncbi:uncharacterized protein LOC106753384 isoform X1 [Vigna radiata var. radiata]|uniref:Uncharacterized protein LOC106753384 isoform X1 n=1 Tax=Vigna radiata var. radiata TaxID=3916 RepID=A0A3Q0EMV5_VIGRR|nr:uncharacterized protein LOC106753384 isoform X1 [Vigna radiata var. radiata]XP_022633219.1 uncharacterized protein LOC106753384 isoform X1 [Vigna radiata var. radiata]